MKIWLDDLRPPPDDTWTWAKSAQDFADLMFNAQNEITEISFDHDIASFDADGYEITGYHCLCLIEGYANTIPDYKVPKMSVHSANPVGRSRMQKVIDNLTIFSR